MYICIFISIAPLRTRCPKLPEDAISDFIDLPCPHKRDIPTDAGLHDIPPPCDFARFLLNPRYFDSSAHAAFVIPDGDGALLNGSVGSSGGEECRNTSSMCTDTLSKGTLRNKLQRDRAFQVECFECLVTARFVWSTGTGESAMESGTYPPGYEAMSLSSCPVFSSLPVDLS